MSMRGVVAFVGCLLRPRLLLLSLLLVLAPTVRADAGTNAGRKLVLQLKWEHEFQFAGYYAALWQGFYAREGLEVEIRPAIGADGVFTAPVDAMRQGTAQFGVGALDILIEHGRRHEFQVVAPIFQTSPTVLFSLKKTPLDSVKQLAGLRIAAVDKDFTRTEVLALLHLHGMAHDKVTFVDRPVKLETLLKGEADVIATYGPSAEWRARELSVELNRLRPSDVGLSFYGDTLYTTRDFASANPELVERFRRASLEGWRYALANPDAIARRIARELPRNTYIYNDNEQYNRHFAQQIETYVQSQSVLLGFSDAVRWGNMYGILRQVGVIDSPYDIRELLSAEDGRAAMEARLRIIAGVILALVLLAGALWWRQRLWPSVLVVVATIAAIEAWVERGYVDDRQRERLFNAAREASVYRASLERLLSSNLALIQGAAAFIASKPTLTQDDFTTYARNVMSRDSLLISLVAAPDLTVRYVYPLEGNERVLGLNYRESVSQGEVALRTLRSDGVLIAGPVELVQGGYGFIGRMRVLLPADGQAPRVWGIVSAAIPMGALLERAGLFDPSLPIEVAIRGKDSLGNAGEVFFGRPDIFSEPELTTMSVSVGSGEWQLGVVLRDAEGSQRGVLVIRFTAVLLTLAVLLPMILRHRQLQAERRHQETLRRREQFLREVESVAQVGGWRIAEDLTFSEVSGQLYQVLGVEPPSQQPSLRWFSQLFAQEDARQLRNMIGLAFTAGQSFQLELPLTGQGGERWVRIFGDPLPESGAGRELIIAVQDITQKKADDRLIEYQANYDALTGLPNRLLFRDRLDNAIAAVQRTGDRVVLLFIDLDDFKSINDNLGHAVGDRVLVEVAQRIRSCVREADTVARLSGDEFTVILPQVHETSGIFNVAAQVVSSMQQPFIVDQQQLFCRVSVGVAVYPDDADNADTLVSKADQAMYEVKRSGRNGWQFYTHEMQDKSERRHRLFNDICAALERGDLSVHYQPIIALATGRISGCEALVRWCREGDWVPPVEFVTVAEETGLISQLDNFVIGRAMTDMSALTDQLATPLTLSVNISPRVFLARDETLQAMLAMKASLSEHLRVSVEITERMLVEDAERAANALMVLRDAGVGVSIDDFGTGYSALGYLARYPVDVVKIDRSFVSGIGRGTADEALIEIILLFAKRLGIAVVAEGVETEEQYTFLANKGCTYAQGYLLGRPMPLEAFGAFVQGRQPL